MTIGLYDLTEIFALLGCYAALIGSDYGPFGVTCCSHREGSRTSGRLFDFGGGKDRLSRNVDSYQSTLRNIQEERIFYLHGGGSQNSRKSCNPLKKKLIQSTRVFKKSSSAL
jgi:hypothetical protein